MSQEHQTEAGTQPEEDASPRTFVERETFVLTNGGEVEVFVRADNEQPTIFRFSINVRSPEETVLRSELNDTYFEKFTPNKLPITGNGSIEGLQVAYRYLKDLLPRLKELGCEQLWVQGDEHRMDAYRPALLRIGFAEATEIKNRNATLVYSVV